jgi:TPR repeat protein
MLDSGDGCRQDHGEAATWYRKAAEQGNVEARFNLGTLYARGEGIAQDRGEAVKWLRKAAAQGQAKSRQFLAILGEKGQ